MITIERLRQCELYQAETQSKFDPLIGRVRFYATHMDGTTYEANIDRNDPEFKKVKTKGELEAYIAQVLEEVKA